MSNNGWISLHRRIQDHWIWNTNKPFDKRAAWIDILLMVNHKENKVLLGNELVKVGKGERITSERKLSEKWGWSRTKVRNFLELLQQDEMIRLDKKNQKRTRLKVLNYSKYQEPENHKKTSKKPKKNQENTREEPNENINNNDNNDNNENKKDNNVPHKKIITYLNEKAGRKYKSTTNQTQKLINGRWDEGYRLENFKEVIDKKVQDWKGDSEMEKYLRPNTLFRPSNFENYLNEPWPDKEENMFDQWEL